MDSLVMHLLTLFIQPYHVRRVCFFSPPAIVWKLMVCIFAFLGLERGNPRKKWLKIMKVRVFKMDFEDLRLPFCSRCRSCRFLLHTRTQDAFSTVYLNV
jgi:hypothetical protein